MPTGDRMEKTTSAMRRRASGLLVVVALAWASFGAAAAQQKPAQATPPKTPVNAVTAKAHLTEAIAAAKKWRSDAFLIQIEGSGVTDEGKRMFWNYGAYSPSGKKCAVINVMNGQSHAEESGGPECADAQLPADFLDSDAAMKIAKQNGITKKDVSMGLISSPRNKGRFIWMFIEESMRNKGDLELDVDAVSGKVEDSTRRP